jgi:hypothetical protein
VGIRDSSSCSAKVAAGHGGEGKAGGDGKPLATQKLVEF